MKKLIFILLLCFFVQHLFSQNASIIVGSDSSHQSMIVKWFNNDILFPEGVSIYRKEDGKDWIKLNQIPIKKGVFKISKKIFTKDSTLKTFVQAAENITPAELKGFLGAMLMIKVVLNNDFARYMGLCYIDTNVDKSTNYQYKIKHIKYGKELSLIESKQFCLDSLKNIAPPSEFKIENKGTEAFLKWKVEPERFFGVNIYRFTNKNKMPQKINKEVVLISKQKNSKNQEEYPRIFFTDKELDPHCSYTYFLKSVDYFGFESSASNYITISPKDQTPPNPPREMALSANGMRVDISWENPENTSGIAGFYIYRSRNLNKNYERINKKMLSKNMFQYADSVPIPGEYFYYVSSSDSAGNEAASIKNMIDIKDVYPPNPPKNASAKADSGKIILQWTHNKEKDLQGYQIFRTVENDKSNFFVLLNSEPFRDSFYIDRLPPNARNKFLYKITAVDSAFNRSDFSNVASAKMPDLQPPSKPFIKRIFQENETLIIEWIPNAESDLLSYDIYRTNMQDSSIVHLNPSLVQNTIFTDNQIQTNSLYRYFLTATDTAGNISPPSEYFYATFYNSKKTSISSTNKQNSNGTNK